MQIPWSLETKPWLYALIEIDYFVTFSYYCLLPLHLDVNSKKAGANRFSCVAQFSALEIHGKYC